MCGGKFSYLQNVCIVVLVIVACTANAQTQVIKQCGKFNEYCQNHWDCCSNSCLTYLYRCTREPTIFPYLFYGSDYPVSGTLDDILELNFGNHVRPQTAQQPSLVYRNRFGQFDQSRQRPLGFSSRFGEFEGEQEIPKNAVTEDATSTNTPEPTTLNEANRETLIDLELNSIATTTNGEAEDITHNRIVRSAHDEDCKEIGEKCYKNDECCSERCHGFLHQCVT